MSATATLEATAQDQPAAPTRLPVEESVLSDRLPDDWQEQVDTFDDQSRAHYRRVMRKLNTFGWMEADERRRAAFVIVEKEQARRAGFKVD